MDEKIGLNKPELQELPQIKDRMTFLYVEHCQLNREENAITLKDQEGITHIPSGAISVLLLGPGTSVTHRAMELIGDAGVTVIWIGEKGVRYYAGGRPLTHSSTLLLRQAELVTNQRGHLQVARKMYELRFPGEDVRELTMQQLRGREGSRIRKAYQEASRKWGVQWNGRDYQVDDFEDGDPVNQALSAGNVCLYGLAHAVIFALGCSPGLGFVHVGHERSFVYDIADLYKTEITIPIAFEIASEQPPDLASETRRRVRDKMVQEKILEKMVRDIKWLLSDEKNFPQETDALYIWDNNRELLQAGVSYGMKEKSYDGAGDH